MRHPLIFGRYLPKSRSDEAYLKTLSAWLRRTTGASTVMRLRRVLLWVLPAIVAVMTAVVVRGLANSYRGDPAMRWTAIGAVLAGAALVIGLLGLPVAISQLFAVKQDLDQITGISELEGQLIGHIEEGALIALSMHDLDEGQLLDAISHGLTVSTFPGWVEAVSEFIRTSAGPAGPAEQYLFELAGRGKPDSEELEVKLGYLRDNVVPKVRAGYWISASRTR